MSLVRVLLAAVLAAAAAGAAAAAERVPVHAARDDGHARLVFEWPLLIKYHARLREGLLVISFARPGDFDLGDVQPTLGDYLGKAAPGPRRHRLSFPLKRPVELSQWHEGSRVVIDLRAKPQASEAPPRVRLRVGRHAEFSRLVFDWPSPVGYAVETEAGRAVVRFRRPARLDLSDYRRHPPASVKALAPAPEHEGTSGVVLTLAEGARLRHFAIDSRIAIDIFPPAVDKDRVAEVPGETAPVADLARRSPPAVLGEYLAAAPAAALPGDAAERPTAAAEAGGARPRIAVGQPKPPLPAQKPAQNLAVAGARQTASPVADAPGAPTELLPSGRSRRVAAVTARTSPAGSDSSEVVGKEPPIPGRDAPKARPFSIEAPWAGRTAAAFRQGEWLWLAFEGRAPDDLALPIAEPGRVERRDLERATVLRLPVDRRLAPQLTRAGERWSAVLRPGEAAPSRPLAPRVDAAGSGLVLPVDSAGPVLRLRDPATGGRLLVVPVATPGRGLAEGHRLPQFELLPSVQGVVVRPHDDDVEVAVTRAGVIIRGGPDGLLLSARGPRPRGVVAPVGERRLFELPAWRQGLPADAATHGGAGFAAAKQRLQQAVVEAPAGRVPAARLALARFYFAHGLAAEALGALELYARDHPRRADEPQVRLMRGAAQLLAGDYEAAAKSLADPALDGEREAELWRAALAAVAGDWQAAAADFAGSEPLIDAYPMSLRQKLRLLAAEAYLGGGSPAAASAQLQAVRAAGPTPAEGARADFLEGRRLMIEDRAEEAVALWREVAGGPHPAARARARFALIERGLGQGGLSPREAIERLERLRFVWRGDEFESELLLRLGDLYLQRKAYGRGLDTLRQAASHFPGSPRAQAAAQRMRSAFERLYLEGGADAMAPLKGLALYRAYRELTPAGPKGDRMIVRLADRLLEVDLLDRAAALLEELVRHRLDGVPRAEVGTRLAAIRLIGGTPQAALKALEAGPADELPQALARRRRHLRARALSELGRHEQALALIGEESTEEALRLAAELRSRAGDWAGAAEALRRLAPEPPADGEMLSADAARQVVHVAVAYTLADEEAALAALARDYGTAMAKTPLADTFRLLAGGDGRHSIAGELAAVDLAQAFMADYRDGRQRAGLRAEQ